MNDVGAAFVLTFYQVGAVSDSSVAWQLWRDLPPSRLFDQAIGTSARIRSSTLHYSPNGRAE